MQKKYKTHLFIMSPGRSGMNWIVDWLTKNPEINPQRNGSLLIPRISSLLEDEHLVKWEKKQKILKASRKFVNTLLRKSRYKYIINTSHHFNFIVRHSILKIFPTAKFIHLLRDGKCVIPSMVKRQKTTLQNYINMWNEHANKIITPDIPKQNLLIVKYESLVLDPTISRNITRFLQINHHQDIIPWDRPINTQHSNFYDSQNYWKSQKELIEQMKQLNDNLDQLGYEKIE